MNFYGTAMMSLITWNRAYCLFPRTTFLHQGMFLLKSGGTLQDLLGFSTDEIHDVLNKYAAHGFMLDHWAADYEVFEARGVGDSRCWTISLGELEEEEEKETKYEEPVRFALGERGVVLLRREVVPDCRRRILHR